MVLETLPSGILSLEAGEQGVEGEIRILIVQTTPLIQLLLSYSHIK